MHGYIWLRSNEQQKCLANSRSSSNRNFPYWFPHIFVNVNIENLVMYEGKFLVRNNMLKIYLVIPWGWFLWNVFSHSWAVNFWCFYWCSGCFLFLSCFLLKTHTNKGKNMSENWLSPRYRLENLGKCDMACPHNAKWWRNNIRSAPVRSWALALLSDGNKFTINSLFRRADTNCPS